MGKDSSDSLAGKIEEKILDDLSEYLTGSKYNKTSTWIEFKRGAVIALLKMAVTCFCEGDDYDEDEVRELYIGLAEALRAQDSIVHYNREQPDGDEDF